MAQGGIFSNPTKFCQVTKSSFEQLIIGNLLFVEFLPTWFWIKLINAVFLY